MAGDKVNVLDTGHFGARQPSALPPERAFDFVHK
jgi:hypothetical protein